MRSPYTKVAQRVKSLESTSNIKLLKPGMSVEGDIDMATGAAAVFIRGIDSSRKPITLRLAKDELSLCFAVLEREQQELDALEPAD